MLKLRLFVTLLVLCSFTVSGCSVFGSKEADDRLNDELTVLMTEQHILETRLSLTEDRVFILQDSIEQMQKPVAEVAEPEKKAPPKPVVKPAEKPAATTGAATSTNTANSAADAYKKALADYNAGKYKQAAAVFKDFPARYPKSNLIPNAGYWLGECYYSQKQYDNAILSFQGVVTKFPKHAKAAASLLKTGYSYERLADKPNARFYLEQLLESYPKSEPAPLASAALARLQ